MKLLRPRSLPDADSSVTDDGQPPERTKEIINRKAGSASRNMPFTKFTSHNIAVKSAVLDDAVIIHCMVGGDGPPLLLLHGYPQTHL